MNRKIENWLRGIAIGYIAVVLFFKIAMNATWEQALTLGIEITKLTF